MEWAGETCDETDTTAEMLMAKSMAEGQPWSKAVMIDRAVGYVTSDTPWPGSLESIQYRNRTRTQIKSAIVEMGPEGSRNFLWDMVRTTFKLGLQV